MVPEGWATKSLDSLCLVVTSGSRDWAKYYSEAGAKFIRMTNLRRDGIKLDLSDLKYVCIQNGSSDGKRTSLREGDILMSITAELGKIGWVHEGLGEAYINQHTALIRIDSTQANSQFLAYKLSSKRMNQKINQLNDAGAKAGLNLSTIRAIQLVLPPIAEQKKIAQILSTWDKAITTAEQLLANSQQQKKALMQQLLTGKRRLLDENGVRFSEDWSAHYLTDFAQVIVSPVDKKTIKGELPVELCNYTDVYYNNRITRHLRFMKATAKPSEIEKYTLQVNDVVITKDSETPGDIAVPALVSEDLDGVVCGYHLAIVRPDQEYLSSEFLSYLLSMPKIRYYFFTLATGATRFGLSIGAISKAHFRLPPIGEQRVIAAVLSICDREITELSHKLNALKQEKKALMQQLLTGKRRVKVDDEEAA